MSTYGDIRTRFAVAMQQLNEVEFTDKEAFLVYKSKHKMRPDTEILIGGKKTTVKAASDEDKANKSVQVKADKIQKTYDSFKDQVAFESEDDQKSFENTLKSILTGQKPSEEDLATFNKYFKIAKKDREFAIYVAAKEPGNFKQNARLKIDLGDSAQAKELKQQLLDNGVELTDPSTTGADKLTIASKDVAPNKINPKSAKLERTVEKNKDGEVESIKFGSHTIKRLELPSDLRSKLKSAHPDKSEKELSAMAERISVSIERNNMILEQYANLKGDVEVLETIEGADVSTPEGRSKVLSGYPDKIANALAEKIGDKPSKAESKLIENVKKLSSIEDQEEYEKAVTQVIEDMASIETVRKGSSDLAESMVYLNMIKKGYPVYLPASANMTVSDLVSFPDLSDLDPEDPEYSTKLATNMKYTVSLQNQGGLSVKKDGGAASAARAKLEQTLFKNPETSQKLTALVDNYSNVMGSVTRKPNHEEAEKNLAEIEDWAKKAGLWDGKPLDAGSKGKTPADWAQDQIDIWTKGGKLKGTKEHIETVRKSLELHAKQALLLAHVHNQDCRGQLFGNANVDTKGNKIDMTDGIETASLMKPLLNSGYSFREDKDGNVWPTPVNVYAANLDHAEWDDEKEMYVAKKH